MKKTRFILLGFAALMGLASCGGGETASKSVHDANWINYAEDLHIKLGRDYTGKQWGTSGIEQVTLYKSVDGDTAHFNMESSSDLLKVRFYGIDTPESTGDVQEYGKQAKWYTADILEEANKNGTIVISSASLEDGAPQHDSTGERYVGLVWYSLDVKNAPFDQLALLNLQIVEYGYSWVKNVGDLPSYSDTFYAAENQAREYKLKLFSGEPDEYFNYGGYEDTTLLELKNAIIESEEGRYKDEEGNSSNEYDNKKVRVQGAVAGYSNNILYLQDFCFYTDEEGNPVDKDGNANDEMIIDPFVTGEYCGINIFTGMSKIPEKFSKIGTYIQVCALGSYTSDYGFQLTDADFPTIAFSESDSQVLYTVDEVPDEHELHVFEGTAAELYANVNAGTEQAKYQYMNCRVALTDEEGISITGGYNSSDAFTLYTDTFNIYITFNFYPYGSSSGTTWDSYEDYEGKHFRFTGALALYHTSSGNVRQTIYPGNRDDVTWVDSDAATR